MVIVMAESTTPKVVDGMMVIVWTLTNIQTVLLIILTMLAMVIVMVQSITLKIVDGMVVIVHWTMVWRMSWTMFSMMSWTMFGSMFWTMSWTI